jgi:uncharacterized protein (DUF488 family)
MGGAGYRFRMSRTDAGGGPASTSAVLTVGHSTRQAGEFIALLCRHGVELLVDVRRYPGSRRHPHFNREALAEALGDAGIGYRHMEELGGRRDALPESTNMAWRNASFRGYADYMASPPFQAALDQVIEAARRNTVALMCAEAVPWRCHRNLISDALTARGVEVRHILGDGAPSLHLLHPAARAGPGGQVTYPLDPPPHPDLFT